MNGNNAKNVPALRGELVLHTVTALHKCFMHNKDEFFSKEHFDKLGPALANQLVYGFANHGRTPPEYQTFVEESLSPCLEKMALCMGNYTLWKPLNTNIFEKTRNSNPSIRLCSLYVIERFFKVLGPSYLVLLPESMEYMAELMEDNEIVIEKKTKDLFHYIEKTSGQSLKEYIS